MRLSRPTPISSIASGRGVSPCRPPSQPQRTGRAGVGAFDKTGEPPEPVTLEPGEQAQALLIWSNWCGERTATPVTVRASLPGKSGYVEVAGIDDDGWSLTVLPRCDLPEKASHLAVGPFEPRETGE